MLGDTYQIKTRLWPVELADAGFIVELRNNPKLGKYLSATSNDIGAQEKWLLSYLERYRAETEHYFIIGDDCHNRWGTIRIYQIDHAKKSFVIGSWIISENAPLETAVESIALAYHYAFEELHLSLCYLEVLAGNRRVSRFHDLYAQRTFDNSEKSYYSLSAGQFQESALAQMLSEHRIMRTKVLSVPSILDARGNLSVLEKGEVLPFEIRRIFYTYNVPTEKLRGAHAHKKCHQFLIAVNGSLRVIADDGKSREEFILDSPTKGLLLPAGIWGIQYKHAPNTVLMVLASERYDAADYIRNYDEYLEYIKTK